MVTFVVNVYRRDFIRNISFHYYANSKLHKHVPTFAVMRAMSADASVEEIKHSATDKKAIDKTQTWALRLKHTCDCGPELLFHLRPVLDLLILSCRPRSTRLQHVDTSYTQLPLTPLSVSQCNLQKTFLPL